MPIASHIQRIRTIAQKGAGVRTLTKGGKRGYDGEIRRHTDGKQYRRASPGVWKPIDISPHLFLVDHSTGDYAYISSLANGKFKITIVDRDDPHTNFSREKNTLDEAIKFARGEASSPSLEKPSLEKPSLEKPGPSPEHASDAPAHARKLAEFIASEGGPKQARISDGKYSTTIHIPNGGTIVLSRDGPITDRSEAPYPGWRRAIIRGLRKFREWRGDADARNARLDAARDARNARLDAAREPRTAAQKPLSKESALTGFDLFDDIDEPEPESPIRAAWSRLEPGDTFRAGKIVWRVQGGRHDIGNVQRMVQREDRKRKWHWARLHNDTIEIYEPKEDDHASLGPLVASIEGASFAKGGRGLCVVFPLRAASWLFPPKPGDDSPPHCTFLYIGHVAVPFFKVVAICRSVLTQLPRTHMRICRELDFFQTPGRPEVWYLPVEPDDQAKFEQVRAELVSRLRLAGAEVEDINPLRWEPHVTWSYGTPPKMPWFRPHRLFSGDVELWGGNFRVRLIRRKTNAPRLG